MLVDIHGLGQILLGICMTKSTVLHGCKDGFADKQNLRCTSYENVRLGLHYMNINQHIILVTVHVMFRNCRSETWRSIYCYNTSFLDRRMNACTDGWMDKRKS